MKAAIFNPYLDTLGGGERYTLSFAKVLMEKGYDCYLEWKDKEIVGKLENKFGIDLKGIKVIDDVKRGDGYDLIFWVSDGSIPLLRARNNLLHFQVPFKSVGGRSLVNKMKLFRVSKIICNSNFTKTVIDQEYGVNSMVLYPPVDVKKFKSLKKENIILSVSRFSQLTQSKRQDILIKVFRRMLRKGLTGWKLVLAGGTEVGSDEYLTKIKGMIKDHPIEIVENPDFNRLVKLYGQSKMFWTASGYGTDTLKEPIKAEHFGMAVVEAMASGTVPIAYNAGGHTESIENGVNGYLWNKKTELSGLTLGLIEDYKKLKELSDRALKDSSTFSYERFKYKIETFI